MIAALAVTTLAGIGAYAVSAQAFGASPPNWVVPPGLARAYPVTPPSHDEAVAMNNLLGTGHVADTYDVTTADLASARRLATTAALGSVYLVSGTRGECLVSVRAAACSAPLDADSPVIALEAPDPGSGHSEGVGVALPDSGAVRASAGGVQRTLPVSANVFHLSAGDGLTAATGEGIKLEVANP